MPTTNGLVAISRKLTRQVSNMDFEQPVTHIYNPLDYARAPHEDYLRQWGGGPKPVLLLGMNPGPFGMAQTGVPFGEIEHVRDWLGVSGRVEKPSSEHPKRPIVGFECARSEVSGRRLWGWAKSRAKSPKRFFKHFFVVNYCPLVFMEGPTGRNRVPEKLKKHEREPLFAVCDEALRAIVDELEPTYVIGVGKWAMKRASIALADRDGLTFGSILHPSPANPRANKNWTGEVEEQLTNLLGKDRPKWLPG